MITMMDYISVEFRLFCEIHCVIVPAVAHARNMSTSTTQETSGFTITQQLLETAFGQPVKSFSAKVGTNPGDNYCSIIYGVDVTFEDDKTQKNYLIKCYPENSNRRAYLDHGNLFKKELLMYAYILPELHLLGAQSNVDLVVAPFHGGNVAGCHITTNFKETPYANETFLIMTDIRETFGFKMADRFNGLDIPHAKLVLQEVAKLHAASWAYKQKHNLGLLSSKYPTLYYAMPDSLKAQFRPMMEVMSKRALNAVEQALGVDNPVCKNFRKLMANDLLAILNDSLKQEGINGEKQESLLRVKSPKSNDVYEPWLVLAHGDCWVNNLLFRYDENQKPVQVTMVDYQLSRECCPTTDLAYFLSTSVRAPLRIKHEKELLRIYFDAFTKYCDTLQVPTLPGFTFENLQIRYRRAKIYGLVVSLPLLAVVLKPKEDCAEVQEDKKEERNSFMFSSLKKNGTKNDLYQMEMTATVKQLYEEGVI